MNARAARRRWRVSCDCATATAASYRFSSSGLVRYIARSTAALAFFEYLLTAHCQPPSVPVFLPSAPPLGSAITPTLPFVGLSGAWESAHAYGQLRMNTAFPDWNAPRASSSA